MALDQNHQETTDDILAVFCQITKRPLKGHVCEMLA